MKIKLCAAVIATLALAACAPQTDMAKQPNGAAVADATQAPKKKCAGEATTGSRMHSCNGMTGDAVSGSSGDDYRDTVRTMMTQGSRNN